jgi:GNAT superfamily N-acetyltransferase
VRPCGAADPAGRVDPALLARLHLGTALEAFAGIFPPEAPPPTLAALTADWADRLAAPTPHRVFVAEQDGDVVGVAAAGPDPDDGATGHLSRLYVTPTRWGNGIGGALHDRAVAHLRAHGFPEATLWVLEANHRSRAWYERRGWTPTPARKPTYAPGNVFDVAYRLPLIGDRPIRPEARR